MSELVVVRHGQASLFAADYDQLSELGREQARLLGAYWAARQVGFDEVYCGPARRQRDTAALVVEALNVGGRPTADVQVLNELDEHDAFGMLRATVPRLLEDDPVLREINARVHATKDMAEKSRGFQRMFELVMARWLRAEIDAGDHESWEQFRDRVRRGLETIVGRDGSGRRVLLFTSVGPSAVMLQRALDTPDLASFVTAWRLRNASITRFVFRKDAFTLDEFNAVPHLADPAQITFR